MSGRPKNKAFDELGFILNRTPNNKYSASCRVCNKVLQNTAQARLLTHRNRCKYSDLFTTNGDETSMVLKTEDDANFDHSENGMSIPFPITYDNESEHENAMDEPAQNEVKIVAKATSSADPLSFGQLSSKRESQFPSTSLPSMSSSLPCSPSPTKQPTTAKHKLNEPSEQRTKQIRKANSLRMDTIGDSISDKEEAELNEALGKLIFGCNIPLSIVDSVHMKNFIEKLCPAYADKLPSRKEISTTILDKAYEKCMSRIKSTITSEAVLLIDVTKSSTNNCQTAVSMLHNAEGQQAFLEAWDLSQESETTEKLSDILEESIDIAKRLYSTQVYAVVSDDATIMKRIETKSKNTIWHSCCSSHIGNLLAGDVTDKSLNNKVINVLNEFKKADFEKRIIDRGGTRLKFPCETKWYTYLHSYKCLLKNCEHMKFVAAGVKKKTIKQFAISSLSDDSFLSNIKKYIDLFDPIYKLIKRCQAANCSAGEAVHWWLNLKLPDAFGARYEKFLKSRVDMALNEYALAAYYLHPYYDNTKLSSDQNGIVCNFLFKSLDGVGIEDWDCFNRKIGLFETLYEKDIKKPLVFWNMAAFKHPNLANLAIKLLQIPASAAHVERVFSNWGHVHSESSNCLTLEQSKKCVHLYYSLRIEDRKCDYSDDEENE